MSPFEGGTHTEVWKATERQPRGSLMTETRAPRRQGLPGRPATVSLQTLALAILFLDSFIEHDVFACLCGMKEKVLLV